MNPSPKRGVTATVGSLALHAGFAAFLLWGAGTGDLWHKAQAPQKPATSSPTIVQAKTIDPQALQHEVARLERVESERQQHQRALKREAQRLQTQRQSEEKKLRAIQQRQKKAQQEAEQQRRHQAQAMADMHRKQSELADKQRSELAALEKQRLAEQAALANARHARQEAEAARLAEIERQAAAREEAEAQRQAAAKQAAARDLELSRVVEQFGALLRTKVAQNWLAQGTRDDLSCVLAVRLAPGGIVLDVVIQQSSGDGAFDRSAVAAIYKSSPLPVPSEPDAFDRMRDLRLTLQPKNILSSG